ncbi:dTDP-4-dehydrorhamnose reductase [Pseudomonas sp. Marseille-QA0892]
MKILLLGKDGQVGYELQRSLAPLGELVALGRSGQAGLCGDLADLDGLRRTVRQLRPDLIVNAAAYTAVDRAQHEPALARLINAEAPGVLAAEAVEVGAWLLHFSTDYVFDGGGSRPWTENDPTVPLSVYGQTKLQGEQAIRDVDANHLIFRTSWVYAARGHNFIKTMLRLAGERSALSVVDDQVGAPTGAELLADVTALAALRLFQSDGGALRGVYHLAASGETTWCGLARYALEQAERAGVPLTVRAHEIEAITTERYPTPAPRPRNSRLNVAKLEEAFHLRMPDWQQGVQRVLNELLPGGNA